MAGNRRRDGAPEPFHRTESARPGARRPEHRERYDRAGNPPRTGGFRPAPRAVFDAEEGPSAGAGKGRRPGAAPEPLPAERFERPVPRKSDLAAQGTSSVEPQLPENLLVGRNPIREAIRSGRTIEKLLVARGDLSGAARDIVHMALDRGVLVQEVDRTRLDQIYRGHQGMVAYVAMGKYATLDDIFARAAERGEAPFIVLLDGVTDPHNLGAIIRTAECTGVHGVVIPERRSAGLTPAAVKAAAGATEYELVAKVANLNRAVEELKRRGVWVMAADAGGEPVYGVDLTVPLALVIGSEGDGVSALTEKKCDRVVSLPMRGQIGSLNASVAAGALMYAVLTARG